MGKIINSIKDTYNSIEITFSEKLILVGTIVCLGICGFSVKSALENAPKRIQNQHDLGSLVEKCNKKAAGIDNIISFEEGVKLARSLGYPEVIYRNETIILRNGGNSGYLLVGYKTDSWGESFRDAKQVLKSKMRKYIEN